MTWPDLVNGSFELLGAIAALGHLRALRRDKTVQGASIPAQAFFTAWGFWNLFYYPSLEQWASFAGGIAIVSVNVAWVSLALHYRRRSA